MEMDANKVQEKLVECQSLDELLMALTSMSADYNQTLAEISKRAEVTPSLKTLLEKLNITEDDLAEKIESLTAEQTSPKNEEIKNEAESLKEEIKEEVERKFDSPNEKRFKRLVGFKPEGEISELFNAIKKNKLSTMKKYTKEDLEDFYLLMDENERETFEDELKGKKFKQGGLSNEKMDDDFFKKLKELSKDFDEYKDFSQLSIEESDPKLTENSKTLLQKEFEKSDSSDEVKETYEFQKQAREEQYSELFNTETGFNEKVSKIFNKDGKKIAKKTPFGTYCSKDAKMDDVYAAFVSHVNRKKYKKLKGGKLRDFTIQLPQDDEYSTKVVEKVLVKMIEDGIVERSQLKVPKPYDKMLDNRLKDLELNRGASLDENEIDTPERAVEHDAKLENGGDTPDAPDVDAPDGQTPSDQKNDDDDMQNRIDSLNKEKNQKKQVVEEIAKQGYSIEKSTELFEMYKESANSEDVSDMLENDIEKLAAATKAFFSESQQSIVKELLDNDSLNMSQEQLVEAKKAMFDATRKEKENKIFTEKDYKEVLEDFIKTQPVQENRNEQEAYQHHQENGNVPPHQDDNNMPPVFDQVPPDAYDDMPVNDVNSEFDNQDFGEIFGQDFDEDFDPSFNFDEPDSFDEEPSNDSVDKKKQNNKKRRP